MNQELTQRIIGAIVVTALAAIFIPMLFEDPVDNSGQVVSELVIPEEPAITVDDSVSRLPRNPEDIAPLPDETIETPDNLAEMEMTPPSDQEPTVEDMSDPEAPGDEGGQPDEANQNTPSSDNATQNKDPQTTSVAKLDTGVVKEVKKPVKKTSISKHEAKPETVKTPKKIKTVTPIPTPATAMVNPVKIKSVKPEKTTSSLSRYYLQAGSFSKKENAMSLSESIRKMGMPVLMETIQTSKGPLYRLKVGPELDKQRAAAMKSKLDQQNIKALLVAE